MISTHILDINTGSPAKGVVVRLEKKSGEAWSLISEDKTNDDGRIVFNNPAVASTYRLTFMTDQYFKSLKLVPFFIEAPVIFQVSDTGRKYHIPLLLSPFGYSTYRGS